MLSSAAAVSRSEMPVKWSRTTNALRAFVVLSSSQHSIEGVSTLFVSNSWSVIHTDLRTAHTLTRHYLRSKWFRFILARHHAGAHPNGIDPPLSDREALRPGDSRDAARHHTDVALLFRFDLIRFQDAHPRLIGLVHHSRNRAETNARSVH